MLRNNHKTFPKYWVLKLNGIRILLLFVEIQKLITMAGAPIPNYRRDIALILKQNEFDIPDTANEIIAILNLDEEKHDSVTSLLKRIQSQIRKSKTNVDQLNTEWWNCPIPWEPKSLDITPSDTSTSLYTQSNVKKNLFSLRLPQQRIRLSSILEQRRQTATIEDSTPVEIGCTGISTFG